MEECCQRVAACIERPERIMDGQAGPELRRWGMLIVFVVPNWMQISGRSLALRWSLSSATFLESFFANPLAARS